MVSAILTLLMSAAAAEICPDVCICTNDSFGVYTSCAQIGLQSIPKDMDPSLTSLDLSGSIIRSLGYNSFSDYPLLQQIDLSNSGVNDVSVTTFIILDDLRSVDLAYNEISLLEPETFAENPKLEELFLQGNPLIFVANRPILTSKSLSVLMINSCQIEEVGIDTFLELSNIEELHIEGNGEVKGLGVETLFPLGNLKEIYVDFFPNSKRSALSEDVIEFLQANGVTITHIEAPDLESVYDGDFPRGVSDESLADVHRTLQIVVFVGVMFVIFLLSSVALYLILTYARQCRLRQKSKNRFGYERIMPVPNSCHFIEVKLDDNSPTYYSVAKNEKIPTTIEAPLSLPSSLNLPPVHGARPPPMERRL